MIYFSHKNYNFIQFWCVPLLTPELYVTKIVHEAKITDLEVKEIVKEFFVVKILDYF
jgi:hypothetical protein